jgi:hypothetical protein
MMLRLTKNEAPEIGRNIREHGNDNPVFAMFISDIEDDTPIDKLTDAEVGHLFADWCNSV